MSDEKLHQYLAEVIEHEASIDVDLWPAVMRQLRASPKASVRPAVQPLKLWASVALALFLVLAVATYIRATAPFDRAGEVASWNDRGMAAVYEAGLYTAVGQSQRLGDVTVTIEWVYADPVRILIGYRVSTGPRTDFRAQAKIESAIDETGQALVYSGGMGDSLDPLDAKLIDSFLSPSTLGNAGPLAVDLKFGVSLNGLPLHQPPGPGWVADAQGQWSFTPTTDGWLNFHVSIPVTAGRTFQVEARSVAEGVTLTLDHLVLAPSGALAELCLTASDQALSNWNAVATLTVDGQPYEGNSIGTVAATGSTGTERSCLPVFFRGNPPLDAQTYTILVTEIDGTSLENDPPERQTIPGRWSFEIVTGS